MTGSANVWHNFEEFKKFQWVSGGEWTNAQRAFLLEKMIQGADFGEYTHAVPRLGLFSMHFNGWDQFHT